MDFHLPRRSGARVKEESLANSVATKRQTDPLPRDVWVSIVLLLVTPTLSIGGKYPWSLLPWELGRLFWVVTAFAFVLLLFNQAARSHVASWFLRLFRGRAWLFVLLGTNLAFVLLNYFYFRRFGYELPWLAIAASLISFIVVPRSPLTGAWLTSVGILLGSILSFPLDRERSDMLPAIHEALDLWASGGDPYGRLSATTGTDRMPYLPGLFFSHLPAWLLGLDLRWNSVFYRICWGYVLVAGLRKIGKASPLQTCGLLALLNPYLVFRHDLYFEFYILVIVVFWASQVARWPILALALVTRQWTWIVAPFLLLGMTGPRPRDRLRALMALIASLGVWLGILWFALRDRTTTESLSVVLTKFQSFAGTTSYFGDFGLALYPLLIMVGLASASQIVQAVIVAIMFVRALFSEPEYAVWLGLIALCLFIQLNVLYWNYFALEAAMWILGWELWRKRRWEEARTEAPLR